MPEEEAFAVLVQIMQQHRMRDMFKPSMAELGTLVNARRQNQFLIFFIFKDCACIN